MKDKDMTPMMSQYKSLKSKYQDALLFFRLGDFYEMFYEDAQIGARELGIALTGRGAGKGKRVPMCGVPHHSAGEYIKVLVEKGYKVAICEQMEDPSKTKGLVTRQVVRVITPGTYWEGAEKSSLSYVACVVPEEKSTSVKSVGLCACDLSTGEVLVASFSDKESFFEEISRLLPKECVIPKSLSRTRFSETLSKKIPGVCLSPFDDENFGCKAEDQDLDLVFSIYGKDTVLKVKKRASPVALRALLGLLNYLKATQMTELKHLKEPSFYLESAFVEIDESTRRNLELTQRLQGGFYGSLAWVLDHCSTAMGSRLLKQWIERPLLDVKRIRNRLSAVDELFKDTVRRMNIRNALSQIRDLERLVTKISYKSCDARDLVALAFSLEKIPVLKNAVVGASSELLRKISQNLDETPEVIKTIRDAIVEDPPASVTEGGIIRDGYSKDVDELRELALGGKKWILDLEAKEKERTGIKSLKVGYNRVFGYYIEVTKANLDMVPSNYIRKQTLASAERFVTPELKEKETAILGAEEKLYKEEYRLFCQIRDFVESHIRRIQKTALAVAELDVLANFAEVATLYNYVKPEVSEEGPIKFKQGRHPVLERVLPPGTFVPNDLTLDDKERVLIITGPNMGGKSTYCRQAALIVLMAQMGCFVPCESCSVSCVDKIFARVGAYDDLVFGQSTFMVEMSEVSRILKRATSKSLVILDEIGRGTSTFDGLSVAWAVVEYLADDRTIGARALVATHYRELTLLSDLKRKVANYNVAVKKSGDNIIFLRKLVRGVAQGSFGIDVAAMAGLPKEVIKRAREILLGLESEARKGARWKKGILGQVASLAGYNVRGQASLFDTQTAKEFSATSSLKKIASELESLDIDNMTPIEALQKLHDLQQKVSEGKNL